MHQFSSFTIPESLQQDYSNLQTTIYHLLSTQYYLLWNIISFFKFTEWSFLYRFPSTNSLDWDCLDICQFNQTFLKSCNADNKVWEHVNLISAHNDGGSLCPCVCLHSLVTCLPLTSATLFIISSTLKKKKERKRNNAI